MLTQLPMNGKQVPASMTDGSKSDVYFTNNAAKPAKLFGDRTAHAVIPAAKERIRENHSGSVEDVRPYRCDWPLIFSKVKRKGGR